MMPEAEFEGLARRVGQMTAERARAGFEHTWEQIEAHLDAIDRQDYCPSCRLHPIHRARRCAVGQRLQTAADAAAGKAAGEAMREHEQTCPRCTTRESSQFEGCAAVSQLHDLLRIYSDRLDATSQAEEPTS